jgi:enoyl-CoA hydratase/carnithine racemase
MTDILITTPDAKFGQPEITLGIIPGGGGTQRLASVIGKARTMDLVLTNRWITGAEAGEWGLASRVTKEGESVVDEAVKVGDVIAGFGAVATQAGKEAVNAGMSHLPDSATLGTNQQHLNYHCKKDLGSRGDCSTLYSLPQTKKRVSCVIFESVKKLINRDGSLC